MVTAPAPPSCAGALPADRTRALTVADARAKVRARIESALGQTRSSGFNESSGWMCRRSESWELTMPERDRIAEFKEVTHPRAHAGGVRPGVEDLLGGGGELPDEADRGRHPGHRRGSRRP